MHIQATHPIYNNIDFPQFEYQEYPKLIYNDPANPSAFVKVNNEDEEAAVLAGGRVLREEDERGRLVALAEVKGVQIDKRWKPERIAAAIKDAGHDPQADPFK